MTLRERIQAHLTLLRDQARLRLLEVEAGGLTPYNEGLTRGQTLGLELARKWLEAELAQHDEQEAALAEEETPKGLFRRSLQRLRDLVEQGEAQRRGQSRASAGSDPDARKR